MFEFFLTMLPTILFSFLVVAVLLLAKARSETKSSTEKPAKKEPSLVVQEVVSILDNANPADWAINWYNPDKGSTRRAAADLVHTRTKLIVRMWFDGDFTIRGPIKVTFRDMSKEDKLALKGSTDRLRAQMAAEVACKILSGE